jgi:diguanylate cyclase (GGDEF)-like protein/PAS domain S-box-containing protein
MEIRISAAARFAAGIAATLAGIGIVEGLLLLGLRPLSPVSWAGLGLLAGIGIGGYAALAGGSITLGAYYLINLANQQRFPEFFSNNQAPAAWFVGIALMAIVVLVARPRLLRAALAEAELTALRRLGGALEESEQRLRIIADNVPGLVSYIDAEQRYRFSNRVYEQWLGMPAGEMIGRTIREVWGEARYARLRPNIERALRGEQIAYDYADGGRQILASYVPDRDAGGRVKGFFVLGSDITQLAKARRQLHEAHERLEAALDGSNIALWDTDLRTGRVYLSDAWAAMLGNPPGDTVTNIGELLRLVHIDDLDAARHASLEVMKGLRPYYALEHRVRARDGEWKWILSRGRVTERDPATGRALRMLGTNVDITERKAIEQAIQSVAHTDPLTGLANRLLFLDRLRGALARAHRHGTQIAVLYIDLDEFKQVNDSLGHAAGDALLRDFALRLRTCVRASDTVARFGGDEFVVLLEELKEREDAARVAEKIIEAAQRPFALEGKDCVVTASIGIASSAGGLGEDDLLKRADAALYAAKAAGSNTYRMGEGLAPLNK